MSQPVSLPFRPRLADHALLRRHLVGGRELLIVHDTLREEVLEIDERQLQILLGCDGTRDLGGIVLAAVRAGAYHRSSELETLLIELQQRGLLVDGIEVTHSPAQARGDRPLEVLDRFVLTCDGNGGCCQSYGSIAFSAAEADRAVAAVPELLADGRSGSGPGAARGAAHLFLPLTGSVAGAQCAVTLVDGRCAFLDDDQRCRIHSSAGGAAKPRGCQIFPATFVDDGTAIRVSVAVECPCVLASLGRTDGEPLIAPGTDWAGDLSACRIERLPLEIAVTPETTAPRAELRHWAAGVAERFDAVDDGVAAFWALGAAVLESGLSVPAAHQALDQAAPPTVGALTMRLMALAATTRAKRDSVAGWRSDQDRARRLSIWLDDVAQALLEPATAQARLADRPGLADHERFYFRATLFGHHLWSREQSLAQALRDRAIRLLLARQAACSVPPECQDDASVPYPLTAVEVMMRGQGLAAYAKGLL